MDRIKGTEIIQFHLRTWGLKGDAHDFAERYLETIVTLRIQGTAPEILAFYREEAYRHAVFSHFYPGDNTYQVSCPEHILDIAETLSQSDAYQDVKAVWREEIERFWKIFYECVSQSQTVAERLLMQKIHQLQKHAETSERLLQALMQELRAEGKKFVEIGGAAIPVSEESFKQYADKIINVGKIDHAHFHFYGDKKIDRLLTTPPFNSEVFIGREKDLEAIETEYRQQNRLLVLVNGEGGIGKTTLAAKYWYAHAGRYRHLAWLYADLGIGMALLGLKEKLGVDFARDDDFDTQVKRMAEAVNNLEGPCLLVFDNANDKPDLKKHYTLLNCLSNCHILLTSRVRELADMKVHAVQPLTEAEAVDLFKRYYPDITDAETPMLRDVLKAVGYNTLVTEVLAKNMAVFNRFSVRYSLADLLRDLQAKGLLALKNKTVAVVYGSDRLREAEPTEIIGAMYDLATLSEAERYLLSNLAVLPAENIPYTLLTAILGATDDTLETPLGSLEAKGWLEFRKTDNTFKISPVVQEVTRMKNAGRLLDDCRTLINTLTTGLDEDNRHTDNYRQAGVWAHLGAAVIQAMPTPDVDLSYLSQNIGNYHRDTGNLSMMLQSYQKMLEIQVALCVAEPDNAHFKHGLAISYSKLGETHSSLGKLDEALSFYEEYNRLEKELYASYPQHVSFKNGLAISYSKLGETHSSLGNLDEALSFFEEFNRLEKELYASYPQHVSFKHDLATSYSKLGSTHISLGKLDEALSFYEESNRLEKELYASYPQHVSFKNGLAISYSKLGETHSSLGNLDEALSFFEEFNRLEKELYASYPQHVSFKHDLATSYSKLGSTHISLGKLDEALSFYEESNRLEKELYASYPQHVSFKNGLAISYSKLGETHSSLGNLDEALSFFEEFNRLEKELYASYPQNVSFKNGLATSWLLLGQFYQNQLKDPDKAHACIRQGYDLHVELVRDFPDHPAFKGNYAWARKQLGITP